eukprot:3826276-Rhodomonas_salina.1
MVWACWDASRVLQRRAECFRAGVLMAGGGVRGREQAESESERAKKRAAALEEELRTLQLKLLVRSSPAFFRCFCSNLVLEATASSFSLHAHPRNQHGSDHGDAAGIVCGGGRRRKRRSSGY